MRTKSQNRESNSDGSIETRLRAARPLIPAPEGFAESVMANLDGKERDEAVLTHRTELRWPRFALGFVTIAIASLAVFRVSNQPAIENGAPAIFVASTAAPAETRIPIPPLEGIRFQEFTRQLDQPLEKELQNVISDTRQAIQFVASSFLPEK